MGFLKPPDNHEKTATRAQKPVKSAKKNGQFTANDLINSLADSR